MNLLLDENLPRRHKQDLSEYEVYTVEDCNWRGVSNGLLLERMIQQKFEVLLTFDKNLRHQQNFLKYSVGVLILHAESNQYKTLQLLVPKIKAVLSQTVKSGPVVIE
jgi:hypothetical protein